MLPTILIVDDEIEILRAFERLLHKDYRVITFTNPLDAIAFYRQTPCHIVMSDIRMPVMDGADFLKEIYAINSKSKRIALTGYADIEQAKKAVNESKVSFYLDKPWNNEELLSLLRKLVDEIRQDAKLVKTVKRLNQTNRNLIETHQSDCLISEMLQEKQVEAGNKIQKLTSISQELLLMNVNLIALSSNEVAGHSIRVAKQAKVIAKTLSMSEAECVQVHLAGLFHRIGLPSLPENLMQLQWHEMTIDEQHAFKSFAEVSAKMMAEMSYLAQASVIVQHLFENVNGKGIPDKLTKEEIPTGSRILRVVIWFDLLINGQITGMRITPNEAFAKLSKMTHELDLVIVRQLEKVIQPDNHNFAFECPVTVHQLQTGMTLAQDIDDFNEHKLLSESSVLTEAAIERLKTIQQEAKRPLLIYVKTLKAHDLSVSMAN